MTPTPEQIERALMRWAEAEQKMTAALLTEPDSIVDSVGAELRKADEDLLDIGRALLAKRRGK